jgi:hypothetical protein
LLSLLQKKEYQKKLSKLKREANKQIKKEYPEIAKMFKLTRIMKLIKKEYPEIAKIGVGACETRSL